MQKKAPKKTKWEKTKRSFALECLGGHIETITATKNGKTNRVTEDGPLYAALFCLVRKRGKSFVLELAGAGDQVLAAFMAHKLNELMRKKLPSVIKSGLDDFIRKAKA